MQVFLSLGSNLGNKKENIETAMQLISKNCGKILLKSDYIETKAWGFNSNNTFLNNVIKIDTKLSEFDLLSKLLKIETNLGRIRENKGYADRIIDIDILFYENIIINTENLKLPHPLLHKRDFVLIPLNQIAPELIHPVLKKTITELLNDLQNN